MSRRTPIGSLVIYTCMLVAAGCQQQPSSPTTTPEPKPAAVAREQNADSPATDSPATETPATETAASETAASDATHAPATATDSIDGNNTVPQEKLRLKPPPATAENAGTPPLAPVDGGSETAGQATASPDEAEAMSDDGVDDYEIDPEILAHIQAQERAIRKIADTYAAPPGAKQLGKQADLWIDMKAKRVYIDGYVAMRRGPLEMFACPVGTKEHESVVAVFAKSSEVHAALLAIGAQSGTPVRWNPDFLPPTGQTITVWATWRSPERSTAPEPTDDSDPSSAAAESSSEAAESSSEPAEFVPGDEFHVVDARKWVRNMKTKAELAEPWVFAGSTFWSDPEDNIEHYSADAGDMICVSNFSSAMLDVPFNSSADAGNLLFEPFSENIPERGTPVRLVLVPQPIPSDTPAPPLPVDPTTPPDQGMLPIAGNAQGDASDTNE